MQLTNWLLSGFLVASPLAAVANQVNVETEDPVLLAVPVAAMPCQFAVTWEAAQPHVGDMIAMAQG